MTDDNDGLGSTASADSSTTTGLTSSSQRLRLRGAPMPQTREMFEEMARLYDNEMQRMAEENAQLRAQLHSCSQKLSSARRIAHELQQQHYTD